MSLKVVFVLVVLFLAADVGTPAQNGAAFFDSEGVRIHYADLGRGEPVVLIHGFTGSYTRHWEPPIVGEHDSNLEAVTRMAGVLPGLQVVEIPGASHATSVRPSAEPLVRFLDRHRDR